ncbi:MAG: hypothetical protein ACN4A7_05390 [Thermacetogeniaceae bacterium]
MSWPRAVRACAAAEGSEAEDDKEVIAVPFGDGTGPLGKGAGSGGGGRGGAGRGKGRSATGRGRGQMNQAGSAEECVCPACGARVPHQRGVPCTSINCPNCGAKMVRKL